MHSWGDKNFDWEGLDEAITMIDKKLRFWRVGILQSKEKFGTCRIYCKLGWNSLHDITHPGHAFYRYPKWLKYIDIYGFSNIIPLLNYLVVPIHRWAYHNAYKLACEKYPHLVEEICCMADYGELIEDLWKTPKKEDR